MAPFLTKDQLLALAMELFRGTSGKDLKTVIIKMQTLASVARNAGSLLDEILSSHLEFFTKEMEGYLEEDMIEEIEEEHLSQYLQCLFQITDTYFKNSDRVAVRWLKEGERKQDLINSIGKALHFNPNMPEFLEFDEEDEDEEEDSEQHQKDTSWKVRKASIRLLRTLLHAKEDPALGKEATTLSFDKVLSLIKHVDGYISDDVFEYTLDVGLDDAATPLPRRSLRQRSRFSRVSDI